LPAAVKVSRFRNEPNVPLVVPRSNDRFGLSNSSTSPGGHASSPGAPLPVTSSGVTINSGSPLMARMYVDTVAELAAIAVEPPLTLLSTLTRVSLPAVVENAPAYESSNPRTVSEFAVLPITATPANDDPPPGSLNTPLNTSVSGEPA
jgi:hypothetical protein